MNKETIYGIDGTNGRNDGDASGNPSSSKGGHQGEVTGHDVEERDFLTIHNSNRRLDKYLLYFSSRL